MACTSTAECSWARELGQSNGEADLVSSKSGRVLSVLFSRMCLCACVCCVCIGLPNTTLGFTPKAFKHRLDVPSYPLETQMPSIRTPYNSLFCGLCFRHHGFGLAIGEATTLHALYRFAMINVLFARCNGFSIFGIGVFRGWLDSSL